ncbi:hypothetical protein [Micromonospora chersina]|uniref:hypothetical protein n=1 Tax=Micromonospora chersina TaxID=47854 RepID=UPI00142F336A|nr:hypothetical protein [Micromonospora chersina]
MRQLRALDRLYSWPDNWTASAIVGWCRPPRKYRDYGYPRTQVPWHSDYDWRANSEDPRAVIEIAFGRVSKKARRELRRLVTPADERLQTLWLNNPFAHPHLPWWLRTFDY